VRCVGRQIATRTRDWPLARLAASSDAHAHSSAAVRVCARCLELSVGTHRGGPPLVGRSRTCAAPFLFEQSRSLTIFSSGYACLSRYRHLDGLYSTCEGGASLQTLRGTDVSAITRISVSRAVCSQPEVSALCMLLAVNSHCEGFLLVPSRI
jgi:hypothetical protein